MRRRAWGLSVVAVLWALTTGCGYSLAGRGDFLPSYIQSVGVPEFVNRTPVFSLETQLTQKVRTEFLSRGKYKILPETTGADAVLTGEVIAIVATPSSYNDQQLASRYALRMTARVELTDARDKKILWQNPGLVFSEEFEVQGNSSNQLDAAAFLGQDANALDRMTTNFAKTIVSAILEAF